MLAINKAKYDSLTADQQAAITAAAANITRYSITIFTTPGSTVPQDLVNCGVKFVSSTDAQKAQLAKAGATAVSQLAPESQDFVTQIQALKDATPPPPAAAALPHHEDRGVQGAARIADHNDRPHGRRAHPETPHRPGPRRGSGRRAMRG